MSSPHLSECATETCTRKVITGLLRSKSYCFLCEKQRKHGELRAIPTPANLASASTSKSISPPPLRKDAGMKRNQPPSTTSPEAKRPRFETPCKISTLNQPHKPIETVKISESDSGNKNITQEDEQRQKKKGRLFTNLETDDLEIEYSQGLKSRPKERVRLGLAQHFDVDKEKGTVSYSTLLTVMKIVFITILRGTWSNSCPISQWKDSSC